MAGQRNMKEELEAPRGAVLRIIGDERDNKMKSSDAQKLMLINSFHIHQRLITIH